MDGVSGLHIARILRPAVILLEVMMPGELDGIQVCESLKRDPATAAIKIVLLTAPGQKSNIDLGRAAGCDAYMMKPFSPAQLARTASQLVRPRELPALS